jgi:chromosome segregation ATPase
MDLTQLIWLGGAIAVGAATGAAGVWWQMSRRISVLRDRTERSEQARNGAVERSAQAREQIAQLNRAIAELRKTHSMRGSAPPASAEERRALAERALEAARPEGTALSAAHRQPLAAFADTEVQDKKG